MSYKEKILEHFGSTEIDLITLIEGVITIYGKTKKPTEGCNENRIFAMAIQKYVTEATLDTILVELLTENGKDMAYFIQSDEYAISKLKWTYNTEQGEYFISER